jgi:hypothetical protein
MGSVPLSWVDTKAVDIRVATSMQSIRACCRPRPLLPRTAAARQARWVVPALARVAARALELIGIVHSASGVGGAGHTDIVLQRVHVVLVVGPCGAGWRWNEAAEYRARENRHHCDCLRGKLLINCRADPTNVTAPRETHCKLPRATQFFQSDTWNRCLQRTRDQTNPCQGCTLVRGM